MERSKNFKRIHLDADVLIQYGNTPEGSASLRNPASMANPRSSRLNQRLQPRPSRKQNFGFVSASAVLNSKRAESSLLKSSNTDIHSPNTSNDVYRRVSKSSKKLNKFKPQSNTLMSYIDVKKKARKRPVVMESHETGSSSFKSASSLVVSGSSASIPSSSAVTSVSFVDVIDLRDYDSSSVVKEPAKSVCALGSSKRNSQNKTSIRNSSDREVQRIKPANSSKGENSSMGSYGLLGELEMDDWSSDSDFDDPQPEWFSSLPDEIIEMILCHLPTREMYTICRVCKRWNTIVNSAKFMPHKKLYHRVRLRSSSADCHPLVMDVKTLISQDNPTLLLPSFIRLIKNFKPVTSQSSHLYLSGHRLYTVALHLAEKKFPDLLSSPKELNSWSFIALLVSVSESVSDVSAIFTHLLHPVTQCSVMEALECLYAIGTVLLLYMRTHPNGIWNRLHYSIYHAIYLYENDSQFCNEQLLGAKHGGQQTITKYCSGKTNLTHEQLRICNYDMKSKDTVKIIAFAGTGKTTTLVRYTQMRPNLKFLLIVYNKSVQEHARAKFPKNVVCKTGHSVAYLSYGLRYSQAGQLAGNLKVNDVINVMTACKGESLYVQAKFVVTTVKNFMSSADLNITTAHVPDAQQIDSGNKIVVLGGHQMKMHYAEQAEKVWNVMTDVTDGRIKNVHDGYLKQFQLNKNCRLWFSKGCPPDVVLIDEAQDLTPALIDIVCREEQPKILVGDPHQQIYAFRGAVNAMDRITANHVFYLTQSFRFGAQIAYVANTCLSVLKNEKTKFLVGNSGPGTIMGNRDGQLAIITRTNFGLYNEAVKKCCYSEEHSRVAFVGGTGGFGFDDILDIYVLIQPEDNRGGRLIRNAFIKNFASFNELEKYATRTLDNELLGKIKIVKTHMHNLPSQIRKIRCKAIYDMDTADIIFGTAHKCKGLEFSTVRVTDDFLDIDESVLDNAQLLSADECNLLYVAATRAKKSLQMSASIYHLMAYMGERFCYPSMEKNSDGKNIVVLRKKPVTLGGGTTVPGGTMNTEYIRQHHSELIELYT